MERTSPTSEEMKPPHHHRKNNNTTALRPKPSMHARRSFILHGDRNTSQNNSPGPKYFTMTERQGQPHDTVTDPSPTITPIPDRIPHPASSLPPPPPPHSIHNFHTIHLQLRPNGAPVDLFSCLPLQERKSCAV